ncbi:MAG: FAD-binding monooxygenase [Rhodospirillaceae bacterium]|nr:FAD-binding monooxygenase [Rhodospirillaceae bacterium]|tara:strand:+ start:4712 stop:5935 length:1224 start_codon:yes stop_codon:yes gene_type:complete
MAYSDPIIISGAGPVAMVLAVALYRQGVPFISFEQLPEPFVDQRAASHHPPTVEMLDKIGLAEHMINEGLKSPIYRFHDRVTHDVIAEFDLGLLSDEVPFPYVVQYEQYKLVRKILELFGHNSDFNVQFSRAVKGFKQYGDHVIVEIENADGSSEMVRGSFLVGCDGGRSTVRKTADISFEGFTYPEKFIKIGTYFDLTAHDNRIAIRNYFSHPEEWCNLFRVKGEPDKPDIWRFVVPMRVGESEEEAKTPHAMQRRLKRFFPRDEDYEIAYANVYTVSQCVASSFNKGRIVLAGDSAHVNNPIGGMGLNGGIHDAINLASKLVPLWRGELGMECLDLYTRQRHKASTDFTQAQTIANKKQLEEKDPAKRKRRLDEMRAMSEDPIKAKAYMRRAQLIDSVKAADAIT